MFEKLVELVIQLAVLALAITALGISLLVIKYIFKGQ